MPKQLQWRVLALTALAVYILVVLAIVVLVVRNPVLALLIVPTGVLLAYAGWLLFSGSGRRSRTGWWLAAVGLAALAVELVIFMRQPDNVRSVLVVSGLSALYISLLTLLRNHYWRQRRQAGTLSMPHQATNFRRPFLIINPKSGNGRAIKAHIESLAKSQGITVITLQPGDDMESVARLAAEHGADVIGVSGGDGSIGAVAKVALEYDVPMVVLPGGTRCHFARDIGLDPKRIADALAGFYGVERRIDAGSINGRVFLNNVSFGLYADIVDKPEYRDNKAAVIRGVLQSLADGSKKLYDVRLRHGEQRFTRVAQVLVAVNRYQTLRLLELGRRSLLDTGILQVTVIAKLNDAMVQQLLRTVSIGHFRQQRPMDNFYQWDAKACTVTSLSGTIIAGVDGEREEYQSPATLRVLPGALRIIVPAEGERSRPKHAFSTAVVKQLRKAV